MYDQDLLYSWTPNEFNNRVKGAQLREVDKHKFMAKSAMANAYAQNAGKKAKEKKIFDADKARRMIEKGEGNWKNAHRPADKNTIQKALQALKKWNPQSKGGN